MSRWKDRAVGFLAGAVLFSGVAYASGTLQSIQVSMAPITYYFHGVEMKAPADQQGFIYKDRTYVPLRFMGDSLGQPVKWEGAHSTIYVGTDPTTATSAWDQVLVQRKEYVKSTPDMKVAYPSLTGLANTAVQTKLNDLFRTKADAIDSETQKVLVSYGNDYTVTLKRGSILNVLYNGYQYTGGAHDLPLRQSFTVNLEDGSVYALKDLFKSNSNYLTTISDIIKQQDTKHVLDTFSPFQSITDQDGFYLTADSLVIYFMPYQYTPFALGIQEFKIPFTQLTDILNTDGPLWKGLQK